MLPGTKFQPVLPDSFPPSNDIERVILMSGKLYYDLVRERTARGLEGRVAIVRIEELAPFPFSQLADVLQPYTSSKDMDWVWVQEEPRNQGAWIHVKDRLEMVLRDLDVQGGVKYVGRREDAVPAPGIGKVYQAQQKAVVDDAFAEL